MATINNNPGKLFTPEAAEKAAIELHEGDPDWTYTVKHDPAGKGSSCIEIHDEACAVVGKV